MSQPVPVFGTQVPGVNYAKRPGVYAFAFDTFGRLLVVHGRWGCYLPGGGSEDDEEDLFCLSREVQEEVGAAVTASSYLCEGAQYVGPFDDGTAFVKRERFYKVTLDRLHIEPPSSDHRPEWLTPVEAINALTEECQQWAVTQVVLAIEEDMAT